MGFYFDPSKAPDMATVSEGENVGVISDAVYKPNRAGTGDLVEVSVAFGAVGSEMIIKDRCNVKHSTLIAQNLGLARLAEIYAAAGLGPCDTNMLRGRRVKVILKKAPGSDGKMYFEVDSWLPAQAKSPHPQQPQRPYQPPPPVDDVPF
jgi:hypothetical protein